NFELLTNWLHCVHVEAERWFLPRLILGPRCPWIGNWRSLCGCYVRLPRKSTTFFHLQPSDCATLHRVSAKIVFENGGAFLLVHVAVEGHIGLTATASKKSACAVASALRVSAPA